MAVIWKDGQFLDGLKPSVLHNDSGLANGLGVFDSMLAQDGVLADARDHFARLLHDAEAVLGISPSWFPALEEMTNAWLPLLGENRLNKGFARLRTIVTGGASDRPLGVSEVPTLLITSARAASPVGLSPLTCVVVAKHPRVAGDNLENCKRLDYTRALAARRVADNFGADEAILTNTRGNIACAATSNVFISDGSALITPPLSEGVLAGVTRAKLLRGAFPGQSLPVREDIITIERLQTAKSVYLTNSFFGLRRVVVKF